MNMAHTTLAARKGQPASRRTVDAPTRVFHWLLALSFLGAYVTAESERFRMLHVTLGYTLGGLLVFRLLWGLLGPRHARLSNLWRKLQGGAGWLRGLRDGAPKLRRAQNLLMALAVALLLALIAPVTLSGYASYQEWGGEWLEELHEFFGNAMLVVVLGHVALVAGLGLLRGGNAVKPMITGRSEGAGPDLVRSNHGLVAALLLAAVLAFWTWQWQSAPDGLLSAGAVSGHAARGGQWRHEDDD